MTAHRATVVTGASSGIGAAIAARAAREARAGEAGRTVAPGGPLVLVGRDADRLAEVAARTGGQAVRGDLTDPATVDAVRAAAGERLGLVVHAAGVAAVGPLGATSGAEVDRVLAVDLAAPVQLTRALLPALVAGGGRVVFVASVAALGVADEAVYSAAKAGVRAFAGALRRETGLGVTTVLPGLVDTPFRPEPGRGRRVPRPVGADDVAAATLRAARRGRAEVFVPRWLAVAARVHGLAPATFSRLARRFG